MDVLEKLDKEIDKHLERNDSSEYAQIIKNQLIQILYFTFQGFWGFGVLVVSMGWLEFLAGMRNLY